MLTELIAALAALLIASVPPSLPEGYVPLVDSTNAIVLAAPETWTDVAVSPIPLEDGSEMPYLAASPDLAAFYESFLVPGVLFVGFPHTDDLLTLLRDFGPPRDCVSMGVEPYWTPPFFGIVQVGTDCGDQHMTWNMIVANHTEEPKFTAVVQAQSADAGELAAILESFGAGPGAAAVFVRLPTTTLPPPTTTRA